MNNGNFKTSDLYLAAYFKVAGVDFVGTQREQGRVYFLFQEGAVPIRELKQQYYNRTSKVVALSFTDEIKVMKALTHEH